VAPLRSVLASFFVLETDGREVKGSHRRGSLDEEGKFSLLSLPYESVLVLKFSIIKASRILIRQLQGME
jgi:hypothetical protein